MRTHRGIFRGAAVLIGGAMALAGLTACTQPTEDMVAAFEKDAAVEVVEEVPGSGPALYQITLSDDVDAADLPDVTGRLTEIAATAADDRWTYLVRSGRWEWQLEGSEARSRAETAEAFSSLEGVYLGRARYGNDAAAVTIVAEDGVDLTTLADSVAQTAADKGVPGPIQLKLSDLHERSTIETRDLAQAAKKIAAVRAAASAGEMLFFTLDDDRLSIRMRTADGAAAATAAIEPILEVGKSRVFITSGIVTVQTGSDEAAASGIAAALDPIEGVIGAETFVRSSTITQLVVTTVDVDTARRVQDVLTADPALLQAYRSLQFTVPRPGGEGTSFRALSTAETGFVGSLEPAAELAATDGVAQSVLITPSKLELVMERDADPADIARAVKAVAVRGQEAEISGSTLWGRNDERAAYEFEVGAKLRDDLVNGYGEKGQFVEAWNAAPMP